MRKLLVLVLGVGLVLGGLGLWASFSAEAKPPVEKHPHIHRALHKLREARRELQTGAHDFGGHRAAAVRDVDRAIAQCEKALKYDRK
jgi:hypothetical protein